MEDRTVSIPTPVTTEEAEQGQREWDAYNKAVERKARATGGGCISTVIVMIALMVIICLL